MMSTMTVPTARTKRPSSITLISVFAIIAGAYPFYFILAPGIRNFVQGHGVGETLFLAFSSPIILISGIGFWLMKKWAVYTLVAFAIISQIHLLFVGRWGVLSLLILAVTIYVGYKHFSKMT